MTDPLRESWGRPYQGAGVEEIQVEWQRGAEKSQGEVSLDWDQDAQQGTTMLRLTKVATNDSGEYICLVRIRSSVDYKRIQLQVLSWEETYSENVVVWPTLAVVDLWEGPPLRINCSFSIESGYPRNLRVKWWKQNKNLTWDQIETGISWWEYKNQGKGWLNITDPQIGKTEGIYLCIVEDDMAGAYRLRMVQAKSHGVYQEARGQAFLKRHIRRDRREIGPLKRNEGQENLVVGLIRDFGIMQNVTKITACLPLPQAAGEPIPWGIIPITEMPESFKNVSWTCQTVPKSVVEWKDVCKTIRTMTEADCKLKHNYYGWIQNTKRCLITFPIDEPCNRLRIRNIIHRNEMKCQNITQNYDTWQEWKTLWGPSVLEHYNYLGEVQ
ncbi:uncharacterized protein LOC119696099 [Motacilla alba alba]|uniref:uncharacterized protein LOC119696099 n=1 Tax=Motacilla alba alba TaxID=1094192 RepID=UPI0018D521B2|nr:uncharacterized protein LOC119696099 [Motacilla alba alba]XP_037981564.1 uncharacterized protein LOC119696099 [Motacilla alba alba]XP_037981565.1 uncharacterized protein LOC119696099 [Motacilla alba alba]